MDLKVNLDKKLSGNKQVFNYCRELFIREIGMLDSTKYFIRKCKISGEVWLDFQVIVSSENIVNKKHHKFKDIDQSIDEVNIENGCINEFIEVVELNNTELIFDCKIAFSEIHNNPVFYFNCISDTKSDYTNSFDLIKSTINSEVFPSFFPYTGAPYYCLHLCGLSKYFTTLQNDSQIECSNSKQNTSSNIINLLITFATNYLITQIHK